MRLHRIGDADPADQQRSQSHQGEVLGETLDIRGQRRRSIRARTNLPAGFGQLRLRGRCHRCHSGRVTGWKTHAIMPSHHAAGLEQSARAQGSFAHQQPRSEPDSARELVGLGLKHRTYLDHGSTDADART